MIEFLSVFHIIITVALCGLVLIQDSKGGGALGIGGGGSTSLLGATGAQSLAANMTKWIAFLFAASCIALTYFLAHQNKSVVEQMGVTSPISTSPIPNASPSTPTDANTKPAAPTMNAEPAQPATANPQAAPQPVPEKK